MQEKYRQAVADDAAECVAMRGRTRENAASKEWLRSIGVTANSWGANILSGVLHGHVCTCDGAIVGLCFGGRDTGEIEVLAVLPEFENRGIGRRLLDRTVAGLTTLGHHRLYLGCSPDPTKRSYGFYRHLGWRTTNTVDRYGDEVLELSVGED